MKRRLCSVRLGSSTPEYELSIKAYELAILRNFIVALVILHMASKRSRLAPYLAIKCLAKYGKTDVLFD